MTRAQTIALIHHTALNLDVYEHDLEETVTVAFTRREWMLVAAALPTLEIHYPEVRPVSLGLQARFIELMDVQQPGWRERDTSGSSEASE